MLINLKNKRGDMAVIMVVFMTLLLVGVALYYFNTSNKAYAETIQNPDILDKVYFQEDQAKFYLQDSLERATINTYQDFIDNELYIVNSVKKDDYLIFDKPWNEEEKFERKLIENFGIEISKYKIEGFDLGNMEINAEANNIFVKMKNFNADFSTTENEVGVSYDKEINAELNLNEFGLHSFKEISDVKEYCKEIASAVEKGNCYSEVLKNFDVSAELIRKDAGGNVITVFTDETGVADAYSVVTLRSNKSFFIDNFGFKKVVIIFIDKRIKK